MRFSALRVFSQPTLVAILLLALVLRLPGVSYGLPLHLIGDEEVNVYSALKMLQVHTLIPALHKDAFVPLLYEPPVTAYLFAGLFVPVIGVDLVLHGVPHLNDYIRALSFDPSVLWITARMLSVLVSVCSVYLLYVIARRLFSDERVALWSAFFLATSYLDVSLAATARHWEFGIWFSLVSLLCVLWAYDVQSKRRYVRLALAGASLGIAIGTVYLALLAPLIGFLVLCHTDSWRSKQAWLELGIVVGVSVLVGLVFVLVHPFPLLTQSGTSASLARGAVSTFMSFYAVGLFQYETLMCCATLLGIGFLLARRDRFSITLLGGLLAGWVMVYLFLPPLMRYATMLIPVCALCAGYGAARLSDLRMRTVPYAALVVAGVYMCMLFGRYEYLVLQGDTRTAVRAWVKEHVGAADAVIVDSNMIRLPLTPAAVAAISERAPSTLRAPERAVAEGLTLPWAVQAVMLNDFTSRSVLTSYALNAPTTYLVTDAWWDGSAGYGVVLDQTPFTEFLGQGGVGTDLLLGGQPAGRLERPLVYELYRIRSFGPDVRVYTVTAHERSH